MTRRILSRTLELERSSVDPKAGTFRAVVFTDGEAADGHILPISGGHFDAKMPLFVNHQADVRTQLGTLHLDSVTEHQAIYRGDIFTGGEGPEAEIRRDILAKMSAGHVRNMSGRWDFDEGDAVPRTELPKDNPYHVTEKKAKQAWRFAMGLYFKRWRALEGSLVGLGADKAATVRWSEDTEAPESVRAFWRSMLSEPTALERITAASREAFALGSDAADVAAAMAAANPEAFRLRTTETLAERIDPAGYDNKDSYMSDCVPKVTDEGHSQDQAVAMCTSMWENRGRAEDGGPMTAMARDIAAKLSPDPTPPALPALLETVLTAVSDRLGTLEETLRRAEARAVRAEEPPPRASVAEADEDDDLRARLDAALARIETLEASAASGRDQSGAPSPPRHPEVFIREFLADRLALRREVHDMVDAFLEDQKGKREEFLVVRDEAIALATRAVEERLGIAGLRPPVDEARESARADRKASLLRELEARIGAIRAARKTNGAAEGA